MTDQRHRIHKYIAAHPGQHFNALTRALDLAPGQVQYHVRKLEDSDRVIEEHLYGRTHYYTPEYDPWERRAIAVFHRETARDILFCLLERGPSKPATVADDLGIARSTLEWHVDHLVEQDIVEKRRDNRNHVTLVVLKPSETVTLLDDITPSFSERMLDRFTRLVDNLLQE